MARSSNKKSIRYCFSALLLLSLAILFPAFGLAQAGRTAPSIILYMDGEAYPLANPLLSRNGITYGPFGEIFTALGAEPGYIHYFNRLRVWAVLPGKEPLPEKELLLEGGTEVFYLNNKVAALPAATFTHNGTLYFPLRFLLELCGYRLHWERTGPENGPVRIHLFRSLAETPPPSLPANFTRKARSVPVLLYHHLLPAAEHDGTNGAIVSVEDFRQQMDFLFKNGYHTVTLADLYLFIQGEKNLPERSVVITFDDGYRSNYDYAVPILRQYRFRAVQFPITSYIENYHPWLPHMGWGLIAAAADVFEYHSHSHALHFYKGVRAAILVTPEEQLRKDLYHSRELLDCFAFSYPFGVWSREAIRLLKETGYKMAFTIRRGNVAPGDNLFLLRRQIIHPTATLRDFAKILGENH